MLKIRSLNYKKLLIGYWIIVPILFYLYLFLISLLGEASLETILLNSPSMAISMLITSLLLIQLLLLIYVQHISSSKTGILGKFLWYVVLQQVLTGNILGAILAFFYERSLPELSETNTKSEKIIVIAVSIFIGFISSIVLFIKFNGGGI